MEWNKDWEDCHHGVRRVPEVTLKAYQEWAVEAEGRVREGALRRRLLGPRGRWASWGEMICDIRAGATA